METTKQPRVEDLIEAIKEKRNQSLRAKINRYHRKNQILSDISDCDRQMVYGVSNWEEKPLHDEELQARFNEGNEQERKILIELQQLGFEVILSQQPVTVKGKDGIVLATGKIDGSVKWNGMEFPLEVKSLNPNVYENIDSYEDFEKKAWLRKYPRQLQMYLYGNNKEQGFFLITDCLGHWKIIPVYLDYGTCEWILQRLERNYEHIKNKTLPDRISYTKEMCGRCPFSVICLQDIINDGIDLIDNDELEAILKERDSLEDNAIRWAELDTKAKDMAKAVGKDFIVNTSYKVEIKKSVQTRVDTKALPMEIRSKYEKKSEVVKVTFVPLGK